MPSIITIDYLANMLNKKTADLQKREDYNHNIPIFVWYSQSTSN